MVNLVLSETGVKAYDVVSDDGSIIGTVAQEMATFERRTPGRRYVNARWQSPRWFYYVAGQVWRSRMAYTTRKDAVGALVEVTRTYGER